MHESFLAQTQFEASLASQYNESSAYMRNVKEAFGRHKNQIHQMLGRTLLDGGKFNLQKHYLANLIDSAVDAIRLSGHTEHRDEKVVALLNIKMSLAEDYEGDAAIDVVRRIFQASDGGAA